MNCEECNKNKQFIIITSDGISKCAGCIDADELEEAYTIKCMSCGEPVKEYKNMGDEDWCRKCVKAGVAD